jgi:hypothetical protein
MKLDAIDWNTLTVTQAKRMLGSASRREQIMADKFNRDECSEAEWLAAYQTWEDLRVFVLAGEKPDNG